MADMKSFQKISTAVNAFLMAFVVYAMFFYRHIGVTYMFYHSIPTLVCYAVFFVLIHKGMLFQYARAVYTCLTVYMVAGTICLGYDAGFHLYCISLIPLAFYMVYMAKKLHIQNVNPLVISFGLMGIDLLSTVYVLFKGPVYEVDTAVICACLVTNSLAVFCFLIGYAAFMLRLVSDSEQKLTEMANTDSLTGLSNRNYMMAHLRGLQQEALSGQWLAIADIDDFKRINDTYGHSCGDYVLASIAKTMREVCQGCTVSRWGGEEFLILSDAPSASPALLERLRQAVQDTAFSHEGQGFAVTLTIGVSSYQSGQHLDQWVRDADDKLYQGKASSKNCVIE